MTPPVPEVLRIRNQRQPPWLDMLTPMLVAMMLVGAFGTFVFGHYMLYFVLAGILGMVPLLLYALFQMWDMRRPAPIRPVTARAVLEWMFLGIRRRELGPADGWTILTLFRPMLTPLYWVHQLKLGDEIDLEDPPVRFPARAVRRVHLAPDPKEDYAGPEDALRFFQATVEVDSGKGFRMIVTEADAQRMRQWAESKGLAVCDDAIRPRPPEPAGAA